MPDTNFDVILPGETDWFGFDFTDEIAGSGVITGVVWTCSVAAESIGADPTPQNRLIGSPVYDSVKTKSLIGTMVEGVIYRLKATATISDTRTLIKSGDVACLSKDLPSVPSVPAGSARFDYDLWVMRYPEFEGVDPDVATALWNQAGLFLRNDSSSPIEDLSSRAILLNMLVAHLATLYAGRGGASGMVGRINSKSVNGVSVSSEGFGVSGTQAWFLTTKYGADYWRATASLRTMQYVPGPQRVFDTWPFRW